MPSSPSPSIMPCKGVLLLLMVGALVSACAPGTTRTSSGSEAAGALLVRDDVAYPLEKGIATVQIDNAYGEINVRDHDRAEVGVHGVAQVPDAKMARARLVNSREGDVLRLRVEMPDGTRGGRYDLAAYVPKDMPLILHGNSDRVDARKRVASVTATTSSGKINASSQGQLELSSQSGMIQAIQLHENWIGASRISSDSGRIIMVMPLSGDLSLSARTGGRLSTNFGLSVHPGDGGGHQAAARYGSGTSKLDIVSRSGEVVLDQAVLLEEDTASSDEDD